MRHGRTRARRTPPLCAEAAKTPPGPRGGRRGFAASDLVVTLIVLVAVGAVAMPTIARMRGLTGIEASLSNLATLGAAHAVYAADWNGRQVTQIVDDISTYGPVPQAAFPEYEDVNGEPHPSIILGWGLFFDPPELFEFQYSMTWPGNHFIPPPINFEGSFQGFGSFRLCNTRPFHDYVGGRYYDPVFYPPNDTVVYEVVEPAFDEPWEYVHGLVDSSLGDIPAWASYVMSPAAMFDPAVMLRDDPADPKANGWQGPWDLIDGFRSPALSQALYPNLKTFMLEHHWNQSPPADVCNPAFDGGTYNGCEPYYFNMALQSSPATLFYDLSTRLFSNSEAIFADMTHEGSAGYGLWSRDTPFGNDGYFGEYGFDGIRASHHVLTTDGILGRDTLEGIGPTPGMKRLRRGRSLGE